MAKALDWLAGSFAIGGDMVELWCDWVSPDGWIKAAIRTRELHLDITLPKGWSWSPISDVGVPSDYSYASGPMETFDFVDYVDVRQKMWDIVKDSAQHWMKPPLMTPVPSCADTPIVVG